MRSVKRNGKIELLRFGFSIAILLFHICKYILGQPSCNQGLSLSLFVHGAIGVEFFFLVSGFLMAKTAARVRENTPLSIGRESWHFILKKYKGVWFYHVVAWVGTFVTYCLANAETFTNIPRFFLEGLPSLFMLQMSGIKGLWINHVEWYLSAMMIAMFLLYPLILKFGKTFTQVAAPLIALAVVGYFSYTTGSLTGVSVWSGVAYKSLFRAVAELCLGAAAFELCEWLNRQTFTRRQRVWLTVLEAACYGFVWVFMVVTFRYQYEVYALGALFVAVTLSFSKATYGAEALSRPFVLWLGEMSLPIYLSQVMLINLLEKYGTALSPEVQGVIMFAGVLVSALVLYGLKWVWEREKSKRSDTAAV